MSGGRATVGRKKGKALGNQAGDITSVSPEGHALCSKFMIECKHYRSLDIEAFFLTGKGRLAKFWRVAVKEARSHRREPMLIARQNRSPDLVLTRPSKLKKLTGKTPRGMTIRGQQKGLPPYEVRLLSDVLATPFKELPE